MTLTFQGKTVVSMVLASSLLGGGLYLANTGWQSMASVEQQRAAVAKARLAVAQTTERAETFATLIDRIGWRPGQALRHETIDTTATLKGGEADRLNAILQANHVGRGQFFLRSLALETVRHGTPAEPALKVTVKGDNILVLDRP